MPIKIQLRDALAAHAAIQTLPAKLPIKVAYRFGRIGNFLRTEERQYNEQRSKLVKELGTKQEDGDNYKLEGDARAKFTEQLEELLKEEIEIPFDAVKLDDIIGADPVKAPEIEPAAFEALDLFIKE